MRLEQLVLFGPSDNFSISFGPRVTVLTGLDEIERQGMLRTLIDAMAGKVPNASVIFVDQAGRRVYADRMGATYAESGVAAPSLGELLGTDPTVIEDLVTLRAADLGLGEGRSTELVEGELAAARAALEQVQAEQAEAQTLVVRVESWEAELAALDERIAELPEAHARWNWTVLRDRLDAARAELAALDVADDEDREETDARLLEAVDELRSAGEAWAEAGSAAEDLANRLGPLPPVSDADLARVAATPEEVPADVDERVAAVLTTTEARHEAEAALSEARRPATDPGDGIVYHLAQLDQDRLWAAYVAARKAEAIYEAELAERQGEVDPAAESQVDHRHQEVVRAQREQERFARPGLIGSATLAASAVLAALEVSVLVAVLAAAGAVGLAVWLLVLPRRKVAAAQLLEDEALAEADAASWLGLHLRRLDEVMSHDRSGLSAALDLRASTRIDWEELTDGVSLDAAGERQAAIEAHAAATDPDARAAREQRCKDELARTRRAEGAARRTLLTTIEGFGLSEEGVADLDPSQIRSVLEQRAAAGRFARDAIELQHQLATATSAKAILDRLLRRLGFDDGDLTGRLERAITAVEAARKRRSGDHDTRAREDLEAEVARLGELVVRDRRLSWDHTSDPTEPPADQAMLMDERRALADQIASVRVPDIAAVERRTNVAADRARALEAELATLAGGPSAVRRRLADRIARTTWIGSEEEALPLIIDDALATSAPEELFALLDMVVRLSTRTQVVLLSSDPTIAKWARREAAHGVITLFESAGAELR